MVFSGVIVIYVFERAEARESGAQWFPEGTVELGPPGFVFWTLILSVFTVQWAVQAVNNDDRPHAFVALAVTGLFGAAVFNQMWFIINDVGFALAADRAQFLFFVVNGTFIVFLLGAVVFLALTFLRALAGSFGPKRSDAVASAALYWHTVVFMYSIVWYVVFVTK